MIEVRRFFIAWLFGRMIDSNEEAVNSNQIPAKIDLYNITSLVRPHRIKEHSYSVAIITISRSMK